MDEAVPLQNVALYRPKNLQRRETITQEPNLEVQAQEPIQTSSFMEESVQKLLDAIRNCNCDPVVSLNLIYQTIYTLGWSIFKRNTKVPNLDAVKNIKVQCIHFYQRLRKHFSASLTESLQSLLQKLEKISFELELDSSQQPTFRKTTQQNHCVLQDESGTPQTKDVDLIIKELQQKIDYRDNVLQDMTSGYLKDVQHMKELMFRSSINKNPEFYYEVQYFDENDGFTKEQIDLLNSKVSLMKQQFEYKTSQLLKQLQNMGIELQQQRQQAQMYKEKYRSLDSSSGLLLKAFQLLKDDPYMIWKEFQEIKGNKFFFQVFETQRHIYGINYREIDKLLLQSRAHIRELKYYSGVLEEQLSAFMDKQLIYINGLRSEIQDKKDEIFMIKSKNLQEECLAFMEQNSGLLMEAKRNEMITKLYLENSHILELKENYDKYMAQQMLHKWVLIVRMMRTLKNYRDYSQLVREVKQLLVDRPAIRQVVAEAEKTVSNYKSLYEELMKKFERDQVNQIYWQYKGSMHSRNEQLLNQEIDQLKTIKCRLSEEVKQTDAKYQTLYHHYQIILKILEQKVGQIHLGDKQVKQIESQLKQMDENKEQATKIVVAQQLKQQAILDGFLQKAANKDKASQTVLMDVRTNLQVNATSGQTLAVLERMFNIQNSLITYADAAVNTDPVDFAAQEKSMRDVSIAQTQMGFYQVIDQLELHFPNLTSIPVNHEQDLRNVLDETQFQHHSQQSIQSKGTLNAAIQSDTQGFRIRKADIAQLGQGSALISSNQVNIFQSATPAKFKCASQSVHQQLNAPKHEVVESKPVVRDPRNIFDRLYKDSITKKERLEILKQHVETLDCFKWEQIINILKYEHTEPRKKPITSVSSRRPKQYYHKQKKEDDSMNNGITIEVINTLRETSDANRAVYYENMMVKHKNQTRRMYGTQQMNRSQKHQSAQKDQRQQCEQHSTSCFH